MKKLLFLLCVSTLVFAGCSKDGDGSKGRSIVFVEESASLFRNETQNLLLNFSDGEAVDSKDLKWKSSNPSLVSVTQNGQITAGSKLGTAIITASYSDENTATCTVEVTPDVHVCGYNPKAYTSNSHALYWKNNEKVKKSYPGLSTTYYTGGIFVSDNGVYVAGRRMDGNRNFAMCWNLTSDYDYGYELDRGLNSSAYSVFVEGKDVFVAGENDDKPGYWKNGTWVQLSNSKGTARSIVIKNNDVYVGGSIDIGVVTSPVYWKNGQEVKLAFGDYQGIVSEIFVSDHSVYVAGQAYGKDKTPIALYWQNTQPVTLTDGSHGASATGIYVLDNDVYVCGVSNSKAVYWKNGEEIVLSNGLNASSIKVLNGHVYVAGCDNQWAKYWDNGIPHVFWVDDYRTYATGIYVK